MLDSIKNNSGYIVIMALWSVVGMLSTPLAFIVILGNLILFFAKERYFEALLGMLFLFILSDNTQELWQFAKDIKPYYLLLFGVLVITKYDELIQMPLIIKALTGVLLVSFFCAQFSHDAFVAVQKTLSYGLILVVVPNIVIYEYNRIGKVFYSNVIAFTIIIHLISLSVILTFPEVGTSHGGRWQGAFGNPNGLGLFLIVSYVLYGSIKKEFPTIFKRGENIFYLLLTLSFVWMSGSRTALISILIFEFVIFGFKYSKPLTVIALASFIVYFDFLYEFLLGLLYDLGLSEDLRLDNIKEGSGRIIAWYFAWEDIQRNTLILGKGMGYDEFIMKANARTLGELGHEGGVHNSYLIIWLNTGLIGLIAFLVGYFRLFIQGIKTKTYGFALTCSILFSANFEPWLTSSLNPYLTIFLIAITLMLTKTDNNEEEASEAELSAA